MYAVLRTNWTFACSLINYVSSIRLNQNITTEKRHVGNQLTLQCNVQRRLECWGQSSSKCRNNTKKW